MTVGRAVRVPPSRSTRQMATKEPSSSTGTGAGSGSPGGAGHGGSGREPQRDPARDKAIDLALAAIDKQFGKGAIMRLGKDPIDREVHVIPTGSLGLDLALGIGGLPRGRVVEIYGPESSGKTTLTLHIIAEAQKRGGVCAFIDAEHALDVG